MKHPNPPNSGFILITDNQGDIVDHYPENSVIDEIYRRIQVLDSQNPGDSPHSPWRWNSGGFTRVLEVIGKDPPPTNSGSSR